MTPTIKDVKEIRKKLGIKQYSLANILGLDQSNFANMENGKLVTNKLSEIVNSALIYLIPKLDEKIYKAKQENSELINFRKQFKNY